MQLNQIVVKLPPKIEVKQITMAHDETAIILANQRYVQNMFTNQVYSVLHISKDGQILYRKTFVAKPSDFVFLNYQMLVFLIDGSRMSRMNLKRKEQNAFTFEPSLYPKLFFFKESNLFCLKSGKKLFYLELSTMPQICCQSQINCSESFMDQGNHHSLVILYGFPTKSISLHDIISTKTERKSRWRKVQLPSLDQKQMPPFYNLWQVKQNQLMFIPPEMYKSNFIGIINLQTKITYYSLYQPPSNSIMDCIIFLKGHSFIHISKGRQYQYEVDETLLFLNNENEKIEGKQLKEYSLLKGRKEYEEYDREAILEKQFDNEVNIVTFRIIRPISNKQMILHCLLHLNEDFDDDLLLDVLQILEYA